MKWYNQIEFIMKEGETQRDEFRLAIHLPYPQANVSGVNDCASSIIPALESMNCKVDVFLPRAYGKENPPLEENYHYLGMAFDINFNGSQVPFAVTYPLIEKLQTANELLEIQPHSTVAHNIDSGLGAHTFFSAFPKKRINGKEMLLPSAVGYYHAQTEEWRRLFRILLKIGEFSRRPIFTKFGMLKGFSPGLVNTLLRVQDGRIAVSQDTADCANKHYPGEYEVIPNPIDTDLFTPWGKKREDWNDGSLIVSYFGRHDPRKGVPSLILAIPIVNEFSKTSGIAIKFKIGGYGLETKLIHQMVQDLGLENVEFIGFSENKEDYAINMRSSNVVACPAENKEGWGRIIGEGMASGVLVSASNIAGFTSVIKEGMSFAKLHEPGNPQQIADNIIYFAKLPYAERKRLGQQAREYVVNNFSVDRVAKLVFEYVYKKTEEHGFSTEREWERAKRTAPKLVYNGLEKGLERMKDIAEKVIYLGKAAKLPH